MYVNDGIQPLLPRSWVWSFGARCAKGDMVVCWIPTSGVLVSVSVSASMFFFGGSCKVRCRCGAGVGTWEIACRMW